ncbi:lysylphosphatidylglycerol synthase transmembrane domain-containing protein [Pseudooceanicola algae]|uniref:Lysylphosphatidylglycerol synthase TM region n=1 Tax=Pseudooceanicola algae TaxID=1537215 RepID=A0A418SC44_9RHOB|nr:lysylphosphatidylglycerol synthase transmembrane domain-containing protein [Pseudooceanicola algae]QPM89946.1 hypothetical protein PSAL_011760 [Pseudooceanicola algae]
MSARLKTLARFAMSAALVAGVLVALDAGAALKKLSSADPLWLFVTALLLSAQTWAMALRWRLVAARLGVQIGAVRAVTEYYLAQAVNMTLPGGVLGDVTRAARSRESAGLGPAALAVALERLAGQIAMGTILGLGFLLALVLPGGMAWPRPMATGISAGVLVALLAGVALHHMALRKPGTRAARFAAALSRALFAPDIRGRQIALGLLVAGLNLAAFAAAARATGTTLPPEAWVTLIPLVLTAMVIPLSIGGWGWREGAAAALFPIAGASAEAGVAAALAFGLVLLGISLPGALVPLLARRRLPAPDPPLSSKTEKLSRCQETPP